MIGTGFESSWVAVQISYLSAFLVCMSFVGRFMRAENYLQFSKHTYSMSVQKLGQVCKLRRDSWMTLTGSVTLNNTVVVS